MEKINFHSNIKHIIAVVSNQDIIEDLALYLKSDGFSIQEIYRVVSHKNQCFRYILQDLEIPENRINFYENCLQNKQNLLVINSTESQVKQAKFIFKFLNIEDWEIFQKPEASDLILSNFDEVSYFRNADYSIILSPVH